MRRESRGRRAAFAGLAQAARRPMRIVFDPHAISHVPVQPRPSVPVRMDQLPASRRPDPLPRDLHRTALWLPRLARRLGHALHRRHLAPQTLDHLLQADRAGQRAHRAPGPRPVSSGAGGAALRCADPGPRRHAGAAFLGVGARLRVSPRPQSQDQPATVPARAVLGHPRGERARPWRRQPGAADSLPPGADDRQPQQARDCAGAAACTAGRGRKRIYGERLSAEAVAHLPVTELSLSLYGQDQLLRLRSVVALARFLKGTPVRAVWCQFFDARKQTWTKPRLLLATETELTAEAIVRLYARRWGIEPLFHNLKRWWGISNLWQQSRTALELWMQIRSTAWTLAQLLSLAAGDAFPMEAVAPWRMKHPLTAGLVAQWLRMEFTGLAFRDGFDRKSQKFVFPEQRNDPRLRL